MRRFLLAMAAGLSWAGAAHAESLPSSADMPRIDTPLPEVEPAQRPMISQGDPAVRSIRFGNTTVGRAGCLAISLYDALISLGRVSTDPATFVRMLSDYGMLTRNSKLRWSMGEIFSVWTDRFAVSGAAALQKATAALSSGKQVLLEVKHGLKYHWVVVSPVVNGDAEIRDPNGGRIGWLSSLYGVNSVHGMATVMAN